MAPHSPSIGAALTGDRLERLLRALHDDPDTAADRYALLLRRLTSYFAWQRCDDGARLADEVMDRVARRLSEGEPVANVGAYALGVARLVAKEAQARAVRDERAADGFVQQVHAATVHDEAALACLDGCLQRLSPERRRHLLEYYGRDQATRIDGRKRLAETLGISHAALRNRMLRLRQDLEACVGGCLERTRGTVARQDRPRSSQEERS